MSAEAPRPPIAGGVPASSGPVLLVHGGAGRHPEASHPAALDAVRRAVEAGWAAMADGGALAAVEAAVRVLEDEPRFDAGLGSHLTADGEVEVDAIIMDGRRVDFGAVAAVPCVANPVTLARHVLQDSPHAMLAGDGALRFARRLGLAVPAATLVTPEALAGWRRHRERAAQRAAEAGGDGPPGDDPILGAEGASGQREAESARATSDTVGAVARDSTGHLAAATSTGGTRGQWPGRVGDSPIPGAGAWADDAAGAVSATGLGEAILRTCLSFSVAERLAGGDDPESCATDALRALHARTDGEAGIILVTPGGRLAWARTARDMPIAWRTVDGRGDAI